MRIDFHDVEVVFAAVPLIVVVILQLQGFTAELLDDTAALLVFVILVLAVVALTEMIEPPAQMITYTMFQEIIICK